MSWAIAREVRKGRTWRAAEHTSYEGGAGERVVAANRGAVSCMCTRAELSSSCQPAPDALDELRDAVHSVAVVRHDAAHAPLHMHQPPVAAREQQMSALARAVISQRHLREGQVARDNTLRELTPGGRALTCTVRAAASVWKLIQRPLAVVRRSAIASGASVSRADRMRSHASSPTMERSSCSVRSSLKSPSQLPAATPSATALWAARACASA